MSSSTQWRIYCYTAQSGGSNIAIAEIQMRASPGGSDECTGGTISASYDNGSYPKENAFDNNVSNFWWTASTSQWIQYTFASEKTILEIVITARNDGFYSDSPSAFDIQYHDGSSWVTVLSKTGITNWTNGESKTYTLNYFDGSINESLAITKWRISATRCSNGSFAGTAESVSSSYTLICNTTEPCVLTIAPQVDYAWSAAKVVALGDLCVPSNPESEPSLFEATDIGSSPHETHATTEPTWPASGDVTDNDITWTFVAALVDPLSLGPKIPS
jgi:hypothetical protein